MSSPVNNPLISPVYSSPVEEKKEEVKETDGYSSDSSVESATEVKTEAESLDSKFSSLIFEYNHSIRFTAGCGSRGQYYINAAWEKLQNFVKEHPEFESEMPKTKYRQRDDGTGGMATGLATFAADARRNGDDCSVQ